MDNVFAGRIELSLPSDSRYMRLARLMASGVATTCGLPLEEVEDFRIAVDELCATLIEVGDGDPVRLASELADDTLVVVGTTTASTSAVRSSMSSPMGTASSTTARRSRSRRASACEAPGWAEGLATSGRHVGATAAPGASSSARLSLARLARSRRDTCTWLTPTRVAICDCVRPLM